MPPLDRPIKTASAALMLGAGLILTACGSGDRKHPASADSAYGIFTVSADDSFINPHAAGLTVIHKNGTWALKLAGTTLTRLENDDSVTLEGTLTCTEVN